MAELEPVDLKQCQSEKPGAGPFALGGDVGNPKRGYLVRCRNEPIFIATENAPGDEVNPDEIWAGWRAFVLSLVVHFLLSSLPAIRLR